MQASGQAASVTKRVRTHIISSSERFLNLPASGTIKVGKSSRETLKHLEVWTYKPHLTSNSLLRPQADIMSLVSFRITTLYRHTFFYLSILGVVRRILNPRSHISARGTHALFGPGGRTAPERKLLHSSCRSTRQNVSFIYTSGNASDWTWVGGESPLVGLVPISIGYPVS